ALLQRVTDVMRGGDRMPTVTPDTEVLAVLHAMNQCRAGVAVVVDRSGVLKGIFTHGDFVRAFEDRPAMVQEAVGSYMVKHPITIRSDRLAVEVLTILDQHRIDDLIVVDESNRRVGLIDSQDLTKGTLRSIRTGKSSNVRFSSTETVELVDVTRRTLEFSYKDQDGFVFMDPENYETETLRPELLGSGQEYLSENLKVEVLYAEGKPVEIELPSSVTLKVAEAPEGVRGDSATNVQKMAK